MLVGGEQGVIYYFEDVCGVCNGTDTDPVEACPEKYIIIEVPAPNGGIPATPIAIPPGVLSPDESKGDVLTGSYSGNVRLSLVVTIAAYALARSCAHAHRW